MPDLETYMLYLHVNFSDVFYLRLTRAKVSFFLCVQKQQIAVCPCNKKKKCIDLYQYNFLKE